MHNDSYHSQVVTENTGFTGPIYANPSLDLFRHFNFAENLERTPSGQPKRSYLGNTSLVGNVLSSIWVSEPITLQRGASDWP